MQDGPGILGGGALRTGLIGSGIGPSLSPALHEREARELGLDCRYRLLDLDENPASDLGALLREAVRAGFAGVNVTHPCKRQVLDHLTALSADAAAVGAVNTVVFDGSRTVGHNTDWSGFRAGFRAGLAGAALDRVVLLGAGGAGAAAAHSLLVEGARLLTVLDLDVVRASELTVALGARFGADRVVAGAADTIGDALSGADGLVHATPVGMAEHPGLPVSEALLREDLWVAEIVYRPLDTALLQAARLAGCRTLDGGRMVVHQAAEALHLFTGLTPDPVRMLRHLTALVADPPEGHRVA